jgi:hypothetical protein
MKFVQEENLLKSFVLDNGEWVEDSILKSCDNSIIRECNDGSCVRYFDMKNNVDFPENIYYEKPEEIEDEIIFG